MCITDKEGYIGIYKTHINSDNSPWGIACEVLEELLGLIKSKNVSDGIMHLQVYFTTPVKGLVSFMEAKVDFKNVPYKKIYEGGSILDEEGVLPYQIELGVPEEMNWEDSPFEPETKLECFLSDRFVKK